jgi:hypothetical protein
MMMERKDIEGHSAVDVANRLVDALQTHCAA